MGEQHAGAFPGLPKGVISRTLPVRDLEMHILEAGNRDAPLILLLHGFPELAYSWRAVIIPLANLGYHVVAPDERGYGRTTPRDPTAQRLVKYEDDLRPYRQLNLVHDIVALIFVLGHTSVAALVGHDFGSTLASNCALVRPDLFRAVVFMSAPPSGPAPLPLANDPALRNATDKIIDENLPQTPSALMEHARAALAQVDPPRKHYMPYFCGPSANADLHHADAGASDGLRAFLRGYFHVKSADWAANDPRPIPWTPDAFAGLPHYYIMPAEASMVDVAHAHAPSTEEVATKSRRWLPDAELDVYVSEYGRTGFQGGLNWYRAVIASEELAEELSLFSHKKVEVPAMFLSGRKDWGVYQVPGALERLRKELCTRMDDEDVVFVEGAGHWVQQEQPGEVVKQIKRFLEKYA